MNRTELLRFFGYDQAWVESGVVSDELLQAQREAWDETGDKNLEHYRHRAFVDFLRVAEQLTDHQVDAVLALRDYGPDSCDLRDNRAIELLSANVLTDEQLVSLPERHQRVRQSPVVKVYRRQVLRRQVANRGIDDAFDEILEFGDVQLQVELLDRPDLSKHHVAALSNKGANNAIRSRAGQLLQGSRFRK